MLSWRSTVIVQYPFLSPAPWPPHRDPTDSCSRLLKMVHLSEMRNSETSRKMHIYLKNDRSFLPVMTWRCCSIRLNKGCSLMKHRVAGHHQYYLFFNPFLLPHQATASSAAEALPSWPNHPAACPLMPPQLTHTTDRQMDSHPGNCLNGTSITPTLQNDPFC